ncbi:MAG: cysteine hydrolase [Arachidicoccus sp.]|nr:cysteine hydrolase [Arachidicoccus sp.]
MEDAKAALLIMDFQNPIVNMITESSVLINNTAKAIAKAREKNIPVIYVVVGFRNGMPEISRNNKGFSAMKERMAAADMNEWMTIHPGVAPKENDIVITKRRVSAFTGSDLEVVLRGLEIQHLVLTGIATSGVVLSTLREAADKDYKVTVIKDCCADGDEEVHRVLTEKVFTRQAEVILMEDWK